MAINELLPEEVRVLDMNSSYLGVPTIRLMENAGAAVAQAIRKEFKKATRVAVFCGKGNNGGDGFVAARILNDSGVSTSVFLVEPETEPTSEIARLNLEKAKGLLRPIADFKAGDFDVIVDAILGVGVQGKLREPYVSAIKRLNQNRKPIVSVDVPSGWPTPLSVKASVTVTFHAAKAGLRKASTGKLVVADIGIPKEAETFVGPGEFLYYPKPGGSSHKGDNGRVLVIGGGPFTGAPALAGMGAMYSGADLAQVAVPAPAAVPVACYSPNIIVHPLSSDVLVRQDLQKIKGLARKADALVIGPGLGDDKRTEEAVTEVLGSVQLPTVVDADALMALRKNPKIISGKQAILTPHRGEFERLTGLKLAEDLERRLDQVLKAARNLKVTLLVKGAVDVISDGERARFNRTGNAAMTVGGTGDVLAGICGSLLSKGMTPYRAASLAAFVNGAAGDVAFEEKGYGLLATDVAEHIPYVLRRYL